MEYSPDIIARFWSKVDQSAGPDACWPWKAGKSGSGYGAIVVNGRQIRTHRMAYELTHGPAKNYVCHTCDNPPCCNPSHLYDGTPTDNNRDTVQRCRRRLPANYREILRRAASASGKKNGAKNGRKRARLTDEQVITLRNHYAEGDTTYTELAREHNVSVSVIQGAIQRTHYSHIDGGATGPRNQRAKGERVNTAKLSADDVRAIRTAADSGESGPAIASRYGLARETVRLIIRGETWRHIK